MFMRCRLTQLPGLSPKLSCFFPHGGRDWQINADMSYLVKPLKHGRQHLTDLYIQFKFSANFVVGYFRNVDRVLARYRLVYPLFNLLAAFGITVCKQTQWSCIK